MLESNHDLDMLKVGPYPWSVKQRVMGRNGHLSNDDHGDFMREDLDSRTATLVLGHLSEHNNHPRRSSAWWPHRRSPAGRSSPDWSIAEQRRSTEVFTY